MPKFAKSFENKIKLMSNQIILYELADSLEPRREFISLKFVILAFSIRNQFRLGFTETPSTTKVISG